MSIADQIDWHASGGIRRIGWFCVEVKWISRLILSRSFQLAVCSVHRLVFVPTIRITHTLPSPNELKRKAYCKYHNSFSHATNDCNVFCRQVHKGRLSLTEMQVDKSPFPMHMVEAGEPAVLICPEQADSTQGKNVIIDEPREVPKVEKVVERKVVLEKNEDGKNQLKIIASATKYLYKHWHDEAVAAQQRPSRPVSHNSQTG